MVEYVGEIINKAECIRRLHSNEVRWGVGVLRRRISVEEMMQPCLIHLHVISLVAQVRGASEFYVVALMSDAYLDAGRAGNIARFINHR